MTAESQGERPGGGQSVEIARVHFERIGRNHHVAAMPIVGDPSDGENVAEQVYRHAKPHLGSRFYETAVNEDTGEVLIEWGRFGRGQIVGHVYPPGQAD